MPGRTLEESMSLWSGCRDFVVGICGDFANMDFFKGDLIVGI